MQSKRCREFQAQVRQRPYQYQLSGVSRRCSSVLVSHSLSERSLAFSSIAISGRHRKLRINASYQRLTFSRGTIWNARFAPDGQTVVYSARWNGDPLDVFSARAGKMESRSLKLENTDVLAISASNEMAVLRNRQYLGWWFISRGTR